MSFGFHIIKELKDLKHLSLNFQNGYFFIGRDVCLFILSFNSNLNLLFSRYASGLKAKLLKYLVANCIKSHENLDKLSLRVPE